MRKIIFLTGLFLATISYGQKSNLNEVREELFYSDFDIDKSVSFHKMLVDLKDNDPTIQAYTGAAKALIAKHSWNPITKISSLKEGLNQIEQALTLDNMNLEIRFLRLYIQNSLPDYLGMKDDIDEDRSLIVGNINWLNTSGLNKDIIDYIINYMSTQVNCSTDQIKVLQSRVF